MAGIRWAVARLLYRCHLPYSWITPRWTAQEIADIKHRAHERAEHIKQTWS